MDGTDVGIILAVIGIGVSVYFGISHVTKKNNKSDTKIEKSFNPKASKNSSVKIDIKDSFNTKQSNGGKD